MMVAATIVALFILGMFFSMLGSSPRQEADPKAEVEQSEETPAPSVTAS